jgi:ATP-dependent DNA ligase
LKLIRDHDRVRLYSKGGLDWTKRYPWIVEAALKDRQKHFIIDGEAVVLGIDGISDFDALQSRKHDEEVQLYAFDMLAGRATNTAGCRYPCARPTWRVCCAGGRRVSSSRRSSRVSPAPSCSCRMGLEGLVSKRLERAYTAGRCTHWIKVKNPGTPGL